jgi:hypothetical protein
VSRPQDYRNAGNLAMGVMDALNRTSTGAFSPAYQATASHGTDRHNRIVYCEQLSRSAEVIHVLNLS